MNQWYLIQFKPNSHRLAERNLHRQGFNTFLPMQKITRRKASRFVSDLKPLFPGYMFVSVNSDLAPWRSINSTIGVSRLVSFERKPKPLPLQLISGLMLRCDASGALLPPKSLNEGDSVEMLTGPFLILLLRWIQLILSGVSGYSWISWDKRHVCRSLRINYNWPNRLFPNFLAFSIY